MRRPLSSSSCRRSPTADEGKALYLDRNDDLQTDDSGELTRRTMGRVNRAVGVGV